MSGVGTQESVYLDKVGGAYRCWAVWLNFCGDRVLLHFFSLAVAVLLYLGWLVCVGVM